MKITRNVLFALLLLGVSAGAASAQLSVGAGVRVGGGHASVDLGFFYDNLAQYGNWIERPSHGWVWTPRDVSASWRPYQAGHWVWSDQGWTWLSDEPYGWATYHYGRWYQDPEIGWAWVPGNDWAPAWVSWQEGNDYVGWAPLPPGANVNASYSPGPGGYDNNPPYDNPAYDNNAGYDNGPVYDNGPGYDSAPVYDSGYGYDGGYNGYNSYGGGYGYANYAYGIAPAAYLFVPTRAFLSVNLFDLFVPWVRVSSFFGFTHNCTDYGFYGGRYFNRGIPFEHVHRFYRDVPRYRLSELGGFRGRGYQVDGNRLAFFRPQVDRGWRGSPLDRAGARRSVITANQFRNDHPDRQRSYAQTYRQSFGRNDGGDNQRGQRGDRTAQQWQGQGQDRPNRQGFYNGNGQRGQDQTNRQRSFENGRVQAERQRPYAVPDNGQRRQAQPGRQQQYNAQRGQHDQANRQRSYDSQRFQAPAERQRQYNAPRPQQQYRPQRSYDNQRGQQRQAPPQRQQYRGNEGRGQDNRGADHRGQSNRGQDHRDHGNDHRQHGG